MSTWTSLDRKFIINLESRTFLKEPQENTLSVDEAQLLHANKPVTKSKRITTKEALREIFDSLSIDATDLDLKL